MLSHVEIKHFQSLDDVKIDLNRFTVIVGPSSSGKSAFTRAIKHLCSNTAGTGYITHGENVSVVQAETDKGIVTLKRGVKPSDNEYTIIPNGDTLSQEVFTKLGGTTPEQVSTFLGIPSKDALNFAGQWDAPFLLRNSASEVARTLGQLTNVDIIFEAARESNRQRLEKSGLLKTRANDLAAIKSQVEKFRGLKDNLAAIGAAQTAVEAARDTEAQLLALRASTETLEVVDGSIERLSRAASVHIPDLSELYAARDSLNLFRETLGRIQTQTKIATQAKLDLDTHTAYVLELEETYNTLLVQAGTCPTCGQNTEELQHAH